MGLFSRSGFAFFAHAVRAFFRRFGAFQIVTGIIIVLILVSGLIGVSFLVKRSQDNRPKAAWCEVQDNGVTAGFVPCDDGSPPVIQGTYEQVMNIRDNAPAVTNTNDAQQLNAVVDQVGTANISNGQIDGGTHGGQENVSACSGDSCNTGNEGNGVSVGGGTTTPPAAGAGTNTGAGTTGNGTTADNACTAQDSCGGANQGYCTCGADGKPDPKGKPMCQGGFEVLGGDCVPVGTKEKTGNTPAPEGTHCSLDGDCGSGLVCTSHACAEKPKETPTPTAAERYGITDNICNLPGASCKTDEDWRNGFAAARGDIKALDKLKQVNNTVFSQVTVDGGVVKTTLSNTAVTQQQATKGTSVSDEAQRRRQEETQRCSKTLHLCPMIDPSSLQIVGWVPADQAVFGTFAEAGIARQNLSIGNLFETVKIDGKEYQAYNFQWQKLSPEEMAKRSGMTDPKEIERIAQAAEKNKVTADANGRIIIDEKYDIKKFEQDNKAFWDEQTNEKTGVQAKIAATILDNKNNSVFLNHVKGCSQDNKVEICSPDQLWNYIEKNTNVKLLLDDTYNSLKDSAQTYASQQLIAQDYLNNDSSALMSKCKSDAKCAPLLADLHNAGASKEEMIKALLPSEWASSIIGQKKDIDQQSKGVDVVNAFLQSGDKNALIDACKALKGGNVGCENWENVLHTLAPTDATRLISEINKAEKAGQAITAYRQSQDQSKLFLACQELNKDKVLESECSSVETALRMLTTEKEASTILAEINRNKEVTKDVQAFFHASTYQELADQSCEGFPLGDRRDECRQRVLQNPDQSPLLSGLGAEQTKAYADQWKASLALNNYVYGVRDSKAFVDKNKVFSDCMAAQTESLGSFTGAMGGSNPAFGCSFQADETYQRSIDPSRLKLLDDQNLIQVCKEQGGSCATATDAIAFLSWKANPDLAKKNNFFVSKQAQQEVVDLLLQQKNAIADDSKMRGQILQTLVNRGLADPATGKLLSPDLQAIVDKGVKNGSYTGWQEIANLVETADQKWSTLFSIGEVDVNIRNKEVMSYNDFTRGGAMQGVQLYNQNEWSGDGSKNWDKVRGLWMYAAPAAAVVTAIPAIAFAPAVIGVVAPVLGGLTATSVVLGTGLGVVGTTYSLAATGQECGQWSQGCALAAGNTVFSAVSTVAGVAAAQVNIARTALQMSQQAAGLSSLTSNGLSAAQKATVIDNLIQGGKTMHEATTLVSNVENAFQSARSLSGMARVMSVVEPTISAGGAGLFTAQAFDACAIKKDGLGCVLNSGMAVASMLRFGIAAKQIGTYGLANSGNIYASPIHLTAGTTSNIAKGADVGDAVANAAQCVATPLMGGNAAEAAQACSGALLAASSVPAQLGMHGASSDVLGLGGLEFSDQAMLFGDATPAIPRDPTTQYNAKPSTLADAQILAATTPEEFIRAAQARGDIGNSSSDLALAQSYAQKLFADAGGQNLSSNRTPIADITSPASALLRPEFESVQTRHDAVVAKANADWQSAQDFFGSKPSTAEQLAAAQRNYLNTVQSAEQTLSQEQATLQEHQATVTRMQQELASQRGIQNGNVPDLDSLQTAINRAITIGQKAGVPEQIVLRVVQDSVGEQTLTLHAQAVVEDVRVQLNSLKANLESLEHNAQALNINGKASQNDFVSIKSTIADVQEQSKAILAAARTVLDIAETSQHPALKQYAQDVTVIVDEVSTKLKSARSVVAQEVGAVNTTAPKTKEDVLASLPGMSSVAGQATKLSGEGQHIVASLPDQAQTGTPRNISPVAQAAPQQANVQANTAPAQQTSTQQSAGSLNQTQPSSRSPPQSQGVFADFSARVGSFVSDLQQRISGALPQRTSPQDTFSSQTRTSLEAINTEFTELQTLRNLEQQVYALEATNPTGQEQLVLGKLQLELDVQTPRLQALAKKYETTVIDSATAKTLHGEPLSFAEQMRTRLSGTTQTQERVPGRPALGHVDQTFESLRTSLPQEHQELVTRLHDSQLELNEFREYQRLTAVGEPDRTPQQQARIQELQRFKGEDLKIGGDKRVQAYNESYDIVRNAISLVPQRDQLISSLHTALQKIDVFTAVDAIQQKISIEQSKPDGVRDQKTVDGYQSDLKKILAATAISIPDAQRLSTDARVMLNDIIRDTEHRLAVFEDGVRLSRANQIDTVQKILGSNAVAVELETSGGKTMVGAMILKAGIEVFGNDTGIYLSKDGSQEAVARQLDAMTSVGDDVVILDAKLMSDPAYVERVLHAKYLVVGANDVNFTRNNQLDVTHPAFTSSEKVYEKLTKNVRVYADEAQLTLDTQIAAINTKGGDVETTGSRIQATRDVTQALLAEGILRQNDTKAHESWSGGSALTTEIVTQDGQHISTSRFTTDAERAVIARLKVINQKLSDPISSELFDTIRSRSLEFDQALREGGTSGREKLRALLGVAPDAEIHVAQIERVLDQLSMVNIFGRGFGNEYVRAVDPVLQAQISQKGGSLSRYADDVTIPASRGVASTGQTFSGDMKLAMEAIGAVQRGQTPVFDGLHSSDGKAYRSSVMDWMVDIKSDPHNAIAAVTGTLGGNKGVVETVFGLRIHANGKSITKMIGVEGSSTGTYIRAENSHAVEGIADAKTLVRAFQQAGEFDISAGKPSQGNLKAAMTLQNVEPMDFARELSQVRHQQGNTDTTYFVQEKGTSYIEIKFDANGKEIAGTRKPIAVDEIQSRYAKGEKNLVTLIGRGGSTGDSIDTPDSTPFLLLVDVNDPAYTVAQAGARANRGSGDPDAKVIVVGTSTRALSASDNDVTHILRANESLDFPAWKQQTFDTEKRVNLENITTALNTAVGGSSIRPMTDLVHVDNSAVRSWASEQVLESFSSGEHGRDLSSADTTELSLVKRNQIAREQVAIWQTIFGDPNNTEILATIRREYPEVYKRMEANRDFFQTHPNGFEYASEKTLTATGKDSVLTASDLSAAADQHKRAVIAQAESTYVVKRDANIPEVVATAPQTQQEVGGVVPPKVVADAEVKAASSPVIADQPLVPRADIADAPVAQRRSVFASAAVFGQGSVEFLLSAIGKPSLIAGLPWNQISPPNVVKPVVSTPTPVQPLVQSSGIQQQTHQPQTTFVQGMVEGALKAIGKPSLIAVLPWNQTTTAPSQVNVSGQQTAQPQQQVPQQQTSQQQVVQQQTVQQQTSQQVSQQVVQQKPTSNTTPPVLDQSQKIAEAQRPSTQAKETTASVSDTKQSGTTNTKAPAVKQPVVKKPSAAELSAQKKIDEQQAQKKAADDLAAKKLADAQALAQQQAQQKAQEEANALAKAKAEQLAQQQATAKANAQAQLAQQRVRQQAQQQAQQKAIDDAVNGLVKGVESVVLGIGSFISSLTQTAPSAPTAVRPVVQQKYRSWGFGITGKMNSKASEKHKDDNQDMRFSYKGFYGVFDGVGGNKGGSLASKLATETISEFIDEEEIPTTVDDMKKYFRKMLSSANIAMRNEQKKLNNKMESTAAISTVMHVGGGKYKLVAANVGDSRVYVYRKGKLTQISLDDAPQYRGMEEQAAREVQDKLSRAVNPATDLGERTREYFLNRNIISAALGQNDGTNPRIYVTDILPDDRVLICSDGISDNLTTSEIEKILSNQQADVNYAQKLIDASVVRSRDVNHKRHKPDDMTAMVFGAALGQDAVPAQAPPAVPGVPASSQTQPRTTATQPRVATTTQQTATPVNMDYFVAAQNRLAARSLSEDQIAQVARAIKIAPPRSGEQEVEDFYNRAFLALVRGQYTTEVLKLILGNTVVEQNYQSTDLNHAVNYQNQDPRTQSIYEAIANSIDALDPSGRSIGQFGKGIKQVLDWLSEKPGDHVDVYTTQDGKEIIHIRITKNKDQQFEIAYNTLSQAETQRLSGKTLAKGTIIQITSEDVIPRDASDGITQQAIALGAKKRFPFKRNVTLTTSTEDQKNPVKVNGYEKKKIFIGSKNSAQNAVDAAQRNIQLDIRDHTITITDNGSGMNAEVASRMFAPKLGTKQSETFSGQDVVKELENIELVYDPSLAHRVSFARNGEVIVAIDIPTDVHTAATLQGGLMLELARFVDVGESRDSLKLQSSANAGEKTNFQTAFEYVIDRVIADTSNSNEERVAIINTLMVGLDGLVKDNDHYAYAIGQIRAAAQEKLKGTFDQLRKNGYVVLPQDAQFRYIKLPAGTKVVYADQRIFQWRGAMDLQAIGGEVVPDVTIDGVPLVTIPFHDEQIKGVNAFDLLWHQWKDSDRIPFIKSDSFVAVPAEFGAHLARLARKRASVQKLTSDEEKVYLSLLQRVNITTTPEVDTSYDVSGKRKRNLMVGNVEISRSSGEVDSLIVNNFLASAPLGGLLGGDPLPYQAVKSEYSGISTFEELIAHIVQTKSQYSRGKGDIFLAGVERYFNDLQLMSENVSLLNIQTVFRDYLGASIESHAEPLASKMYELALKTKGLKGDEYWLNPHYFDVKKTTSGNYVLQNLFDPSNQTEEFTSIEQLSPYTYLVKNVDKKEWEVIHITGRDQKQWRRSEKKKYYVSDPPIVIASHRGLVTYKYLSKAPIFDILTMFAPGNSPEIPGGSQVEITDTGRFAVSFENGILTAAEYDFDNGVVKDFFTLNNTSKKVLSFSLLKDIGVVIYKTEDGLYHASDLVTRSVIVNNALHIEMTPDNKYVVSTHAGAPPMINISSTRVQKNKSRYQIGVYGLKYMQSTYGSALLINATPDKRILTRELVHDDAHIGDNDVIAKSGMVVEYFVDKKTVQPSASSSLRLEQIYAKDQTLFIQGNRAYAIDAPGIIKTLIAPSETLNPSFIAGVTSSKVSKLGQNGIFGFSGSISVFIDELGAPQQVEKSVVSENGKYVLAFQKGILDYITISDLGKVIKLNNVNFPQGYDLRRKNPTAGAYFVFSKIGADDLHYSPYERLFYTQEELVLHELHSGRITASSVSQDELQRQKQSWEQEVIGEKEVKRKEWIQQGRNIYLGIQALLPEEFRGDVALNIEDHARMLFSSQEQAIRERFISATAKKTQTDLGGLPLEVALQRYANIKKSIEKTMKTLDKELQQVTSFSTKQIAYKQLMTTAFALLQDQTIALDDPTSIEAALTASAYGWTVQDDKDIATAGDVVRLLDTVKSVDGSADFDRLRKIATILSTKKNADIVTKQIQKIIPEKGKITASKKKFVADFSKAMKDVSFDDVEAFVQGNIEKMTEAQHFITFLTNEVEELKIKKYVALQGDDVEMPKDGVELSQIILLEQNRVKAGPDDNVMDATYLINNMKNLPKRSDELESDLYHNITDQRESGAYTAEITQNSLDATRGKKGSLIVDFFLQVKNGVEEYVEEATDNGSGALKVIALLIPKSTKASGGQIDLAGFFGTGKFTIFEGVDRVEIISKTNKEAFEFSFVVERDADGTAQKLRLVGMKNVTKDKTLREGVTVRRIKKKDGTVPELDAMLAKKTWKTFVGLAQHKNFQVYFKNAYDALDPIEIESREELASSDLAFQKKDETHITTFGSIKLIATKGMPLQIIDKNGLRVGPLDQEKYFAQIPAGLRRHIAELGISVQIPLPLTHNRDGFEHGSTYLSIIQKQIAVAYYRALAYKALTQLEPQFVFQGLPLDWATNDSYWDSIDLNSDKSVVNLAKKINSNSFDNITSAEFASLSTKTGVMDWEKKFVKLILQLVVPVDESGGAVGQSLLGKRLVVQTAINKEKAEAERKRYEAAGVTVGTLPSSSDILNFASYVQQGAVVAQGHEQMKHPEKFVYKGKYNANETALKNLALSAAKLVGIEDVVLIENTQFAGAFGMYKGKKTFYLAREAATKTGIQGAGKIDDVTDLIIHELAHYLEELARTPNLNTLFTKGFIPHASNFTHDSIGTFAEAMKYVAGLWLSQDAKEQGIAGVQNAVNSASKKVAGCKIAFVFEFPQAFADDDLSTSPCAVNFSGFTTGVTTLASHAVQAMLSPVLLAQVGAHHADVLLQQSLIGMPTTEGMVISTPKHVVLSALARMIPSVRGLRDSAETAMDVHAEGAKTSSGILGNIHATALGLLRRGVVVLNMLNNLQHATISITIEEVLPQQTPSSNNDGVQEEVVEVSTEESSALAQLKEELNIRKQAKSKNTPQERAAVAAKIIEVKETFDAEVQRKKDRQVQLEQYNVVSKEFIKTISEKKKKLDEKIAYWKNSFVYKVSSPIFFIRGYFASLEEDSANLEAFLQSANVDIQQTDVQLKQLEIEIPRLISDKKTALRNVMDAYFDTFRTPFTKEEMKVFLTTEILAELNDNEYIEIWKRTGPYFTAHVTRQGIRDHIGIAQHNSQYLEWNNYFVEMLQNQKKLQSAFSLSSGITSANDSVNIDKFLDANSVYSFPLLVEAQEAMRELFLYSSTRRTVDAYSDKTAIHFSTQDVSPDIYGAERDNEIFYIFPSAQIASQQTYSFSANNSPGMTISFKEKPVNHAEKKWNDLWVWVNNESSIPIDSGVVFLPKNTKVDPLTGSKYQTEVQKVDGEEKRVPVIADEKLVYAKETISSQEYWENFFTHNPTLRPAHIHYYEGDPEAAVDAYFSSNKVLKVKDDSGEFFGFDENRVMKDNRIVDERSTPGLEDLLVKAEALLQEKYNDEVKHFSAWQKEVDTLVDDGYTAQVIGKAPDYYVAGTEKEDSNNKYTEYLSNLWMYIGTIRDLRVESITQYKLADGTVVFAVVKEKSVVERFGDPVEIAQKLNDWSAELKQQSKDPHTEIYRPQNFTGNWNDVPLVEVSLHKLTVIGLPEQQMTADSVQNILINYEKEAKKSSLLQIAIDASKAYADNSQNNRDLYSSNQIFLIPADRIKQITNDHSDGLAFHLDSSVGEILLPIDDQELIDPLSGFDVVVHERGHDERDRLGLSKDGDRRLEEGIVQSSTRKLERKLGKESLRSRGIYPVETESAEKLAIALGRDTLFNVSHESIREEMQKIYGIPGDLSDPYDDFTYDLLMLSKEFENVLGVIDNELISDQNTSIQENQKIQAARSKYENMKTQFFHRWRFEK